MNHRAIRRTLVPLYFFVGGLAGGLYLLGAIEQLAFEQPVNGWPAAKLGFSLAFPLVLVGTVILVVDLTRPTRFWRLLLQCKPGSAVSLGTWTLLVFTAVALLAHPWVTGFLAGALAEVRGFELWEPWQGLPGQGLELAARTRPVGTSSQALPPALLHLVGVPAALALASYTGLLLTSASRRPAWNASPWMGGIFLAQALASAAALVLVVLPALAPTQLHALEHALPAGAFPVPDPAFWEKWQYQAATDLPLLLAACAALQLGLLALHLLRVPRGPGTGGERLATGSLAGRFRIGLLLGCLLPQVLWGHETLPLPLIQGVALFALAGILTMRAALFLSEEE